MAVVLFRLLGCRSMSRLCSFPLGNEEQIGHTGLRCAGTLGVAGVIPGSAAAAVFVVEAKYEESLCVRCFGACGIAPGVPKHNFIVKV